MLRIIFFFLLITTFEFYSASVRPSTTPRKAGGISPSLSMDSNDSTQPLSLSEESLSPAEKVIVERSEKSWLSWPKWSEKKKKSKIRPNSTQLPNANLIVDDLHRRGTIAKIIRNAKIPNPEIGGLAFLRPRVTKTRLLNEAHYETVKERMKERIHQYIIENAHAYITRYNDRFFRQLALDSAVFGIQEEEEYLFQIKEEMIQLAQEEQRKRNFKVHPEFSY